VSTAAASSFLGYGLGAFFSYLAAFFAVGVLSFAGTITGSE
jgi:hypothetical protein